jgi:hypothetical protein
LAVAVVLEFSVAVQVWPLALVQPAHEENALPLAVAGAVRVNVSPAGPVSVKLVVPVEMTLLREFPTEIATPLDGLMELTVSV